MDKREYVRMLQRAQEFANHHRKNGGLSNLYVLRTINSDGVVTDEKYGMNYMTDYGFEQFMTILDYYGNHSQEFPKNLYVGTGANYGANMYEEKQLFQGLFPNGNNLTAATITNSTIDYAYPLYYYKIPNKDDAMITAVCKYLECYFPESINTLDTSIAEYGIGANQDNLWTHSFVYDIKGNRTTLTKHTNERLVIVVFLCLTYYASMIKNGYKDNRFVVITTMQRFLQYHMGESNVFTYKRNNVTANRTIHDHQLSTLKDRTITKTTNCNDITIYRQTGNADEYVNGYVQYAPGFIVLEPQTLDTPEEFSINLRNDLTNVSSTSLCDRFGKSNDESAAPFTQIDLTKSNYGVYLYDAISGDYTNKLTISMNKDHEYSETPLQTSCGVPIYYTNIDQVMTMYVYQNINIDDPIVKFDNTDVSSIYATDEYWSHGSWKQITDPLHIPEDLQKKRYYITNSNVNSLNPVRASQVLTITPQNRTDLPCTLSGFYGQYHGCDNFEKGYYVIANKVFLYNANVTYTIQSGANTLPISNDVHSYCYGDYILSVDTVGNAYITYVGNPNEISTVYRQNTHEEMFSANPSYCYTSETGNGIMCITSQALSEAVVVNVRGSSVQTIRLQAKNACAIASTNGEANIAYITTDETPKLVIRDYSKTNQETELDLPSDARDVSFMFGLNDHLWITDGRSFCYHYNIKSKASPDLCNNNIGFTVYPTKANYQIRITYVDDIILIYNHADRVIANSRYITLDDPKNVKSLSDFATPSWNSNSINYMMRYIHEQTISSKKVKSLILIISDTYTLNYNEAGYGYLAIDFGKYLKLGDKGIDISTYPLTANRCSLQLYGPYLVDNNRLIPLEYLMNMRLVGSTNTITTVNNITHLSNKSWNVTVTNAAPSDYGDAVPPGEQQ